MSSYDPALACRLLKASRLAYTIDAGSVDVNCQDYADVAFVERPVVFVGGTDHIDAAYLGKTADFAVLAFRGTLPLNTGDGIAYLIKSLADWVNDAEAALDPAPDGIPGKVHHGFDNALAILWEPVHTALQTLGGLPLYVTGHSKGGAVAYLAAMRAAKAGVVPAAVYTYAAARCGDGDFVAACDAQFENSMWRFEYQNDLVPHLPPSLGPVSVAIATALPDMPKFTVDGYASAGTLEFIDWTPKIVADFPGLCIEREFKLLECLAHGEAGLKEIAGDHTLDAGGGYSSAICGR